MSKRLVRRILIMAGILALVLAASGVIESVREADQLERTFGSAGTELEAAMHDLGQEGTLACWEQVARSTDGGGVATWCLTPTGAVVELVAFADLAARDASGSKSCAFAGSLVAPAKETWLVSARAADAESLRLLLEDEGLEMGPRSPVPG